MIFDFSFAGLFTTCAFASVLAFALWWIIKLKKKRFWLPILKILENKPPHRRRFVLTRPPLIPFISFVMIVCVGLFLALSPSTEKYQLFDNSLPTVQVLLDLSPSLAASVEINEIRNQARTLLTSLLGKVKLTAASTRDSLPNAMRTPSDIEQFTEKLEWTRYGSNLGASLQHIHENLGSAGDFDIILSDRDLASWQDIDTDSLLIRDRLRFIDLSDDKKSDQNLFIDEFSWDKNLNDKESSYHLVLRRSRSNNRISEGNIIIKKNDNENILETPFLLNPDQDLLQIDIVLPRLGQVSLGQETDVSKFYFTAVIESKSENALKSDDQFIGKAQSKSAKIALIAANRGEGWLQDGSYDLQAIMRVLGFGIRRFETAVSLKNPKDFDLIVMALPAFSAGEIGDYCPLSLNAANELWLVPEVVDDSKDGICHCFVQYVEGKRISRPTYCQQNNTSDLLGAALRSFGAKQVLGNLSDASGALAYRLEKDNNSGIVLGFLHSLMPQEGWGFSRSNLLKTLRFLLDPQSQNNRKKSFGGVWLRVSDHLNLPAGTTPEALNLSNIPRGESLLEVRESLSQLATVDSEKLLNAGKLDEKSLGVPKKIALPWIIIAMSIVALSMLMEALKLRKNISFLAFFLAILFYPNKELKAVEIDFYQEDLGFYSSLNFLDLKKEVERRTSLELEAKPRILDSKTIFGQAFIWLSSLENLGSLSKVLGKNQLASWLSRGGLIIVVDSARGKPSSQTVTDEIFSSLGNRRPGHSGWQPIGPDHELLRSFHLLETLPTCGKRPWEIYEIEGRPALILIPYDLILYLSDSSKQPSNCTLSKETTVRTFINIQMVALTTDYKKDQIHLPEILKRLR